MLGNHWHTVGFPVNGEMYALPEEAHFLIESGTAVLLEADDDDGLEFMQRLFADGEIINPDELRAYLYLKRLGYILMRPSSPYLKGLEGLDLASGYAVFKPNSKFQKKAPSGFMCCLSVGSIDGPCMRDFRSSLGLLALGDESGQMLVTLTDVTSQLLA